MDTKTLIPTTALRFVKREVPVADGPEGVCREVRILQQGFQDPTSGKVVWRDVPEVEDGA